MTEVAEDVVDAPSGKLTEVVRLATALSDRMLDAQIMRRPIPPEQVAALTGAAGLLQDHGVPWPPLMEQVLHEFTDRLDAARATPDRVEVPSEGSEVVAGLSRFLGAFRRERAEGP